MKIILYLVLQIETDFDQREEEFPVVNYPEGYGNGYAHGDFLLSGHDPRELLEKICKLYDVRRHITYYKYEENYGITDEEMVEIDRAEWLVEKADNGSLKNDDLLKLSFTFWEGGIKVLQISDNELIANEYPGIIDLTERKQSNSQGRLRKIPKPDHRPWTREEATAWFKEWEAAAREAYKEVRGKYPSEPVFSQLKEQ